MKLKLSILTASDFPFGMAMESFVRQLAYGLYENNVKVDVIRLYGNRLDNVNNTKVSCSDYLFKQPFETEILKIFEILFHIIYVPIFILNRKIIERDNAIILYAIDRFYLVFPLTVFARFFGMKIFRINTEIYPDYTYAYTWWRKPLILFNRLQIKYFDRFLTGVVVLSHYLKKMEVDNGVSERNVILIPHFIDVHLERSVTMCFSDEKIDRIGFCGTLSVENGILDLLEAFTLLGDKRKSTIELVIIGDIVPEIRVELEKRVYRDVIFTGKLSNTEVIKELQQCDVLVNPRRLGVSADSGFPTKIGEYFALNKPVVATKVGDLALYFSDKKEIVFAEPNSPESLYTSIDFILNNKLRAIKIAKRGNQWAIDNLDYVNNSKKLINFILNN